MSNNPYRKPFEAALPEFKQAEQELIHLTEQGKKATTNLAEARKRAADLKQQSEDLIASGDASNAGKLGQLAQEQLQADHVSRLLENGDRQVAARIVEAKAKVLAAERKCRDLQADFFTAEFDGLAADFLRSHRADFERMVNVMGFDALHSAIRGTDLNAGPMIAVSGYGALFEQALPAIAKRVFADDGWQCLPRQPIKGAIVSDPIISAVVSGDERSRVPGAFRDAVAIRRSLEQSHQADEEMRVVQEENEHNANRATI